MPASRKTYIEIAKRIKQCFETGAGKPGPYDLGVDHGIVMVAREVAQALQLDNPAFDRGRFLAACGVNECDLPRAKA